MCTVQQPSAFFPPPKWEEPSLLFYSLFFFCLCSLENKTAGLQWISQQSKTRSTNAFSVARYISNPAVLLGSGLLWNGTNWCLEMHPAAVLEHSEPFVLTLQDSHWTFISSANEFLSGSFVEDLRSRAIFSCKLLPLFEELSRKDLRWTSLASFAPLNCGFSHIWLRASLNWNKRRREIYFVVSESGELSGQKIWQLISAEANTKQHFVCLVFKAKLPAAAACQ